MGPLVERPRAQLNLILTNCVFSNARAQAKDHCMLVTLQSALGYSFPESGHKSAPPPYLFESVATWRRLRKYET